MKYFNLTMKFIPRSAALATLTTAILFGCGGGGGSTPAPAPVVPPTAVIASIPATQVGDIVVLDGRGSYDPNNDQLFCTWTLVSSPPGSTSSVPSGSSSCAPPLYPDVAGTYEVSLVVNTALGVFSAPTTVTFNVSPYYGTLTVQVEGTNGTIYVDVQARSINGIASVSATLDGQFIGTLTAPNYCYGGIACGQGGPNNFYRFSIDGTTAGVGVHVLEVTATDPMGRQQLYTVPLAVSG
jgi:hypothetical protein